MDFNAKKGGIDVCTCTYVHIHMYMYTWGEYTYVHVHMGGIDECTRTFSRICKYTYVHVPGVRHQKHPGSQNRQNDSQRGKTDRFCKRF